MRLFAYGTLQIPEVLRAVTGRVFPSTDARLEGYGCYVLVGRSYPGVVPMPGRTTRGRLYADVDRNSVRALDRFEGDEYERRIVEVREAGGRTVSAFVYVIPENRRGEVTSRPWDRAAFERDHLRRFLRDRRVGDDPA